MLELQMGKECGAWLHPASIYLAQIIKRFTADCAE
jgi:hypothetical protein